MLCSPKIAFLAIFCLISSSMLASNDEDSGFVLVKGRGEDDLLREQLFEALERGDERKVEEILLTEKVPTTLKNKEGYSPLYFASTPRILDLLLSYGWSPDTKIEGAPLAHYLIEYQDSSEDALENLKVLENRGANFLLKNTQGETCLEHSVRLGRQTLVGYFFIYHRDQIQKFKELSEDLPGEILSEKERKSFERHWEQLDSLLMNLLLAQSTL